jgi:hypothetical protein
LKKSFVLNLTKRWVERNFRAIFNHKNLVTLMVTAPMDQFERGINHPKYSEAQEMSRAVERSRKASADTRC